MKNTHPGLFAPSHHGVGFCPVCGTNIHAISLALDYQRSERPGSRAESTPEIPVVQLPAQDQLTTGERRAEPVPAHGLPNYKPGAHITPQERAAVAQLRASGKARDEIATALRRPQFRVDAILYRDAQRRKHLRETRA